MTTQGRVDTDQAAAPVGIDTQHRVPTSEELPALDLEALRASICRTSPADEPDHWAGLQLILGAALRSRSLRGTHAQQAAACKEIIGSFEGALVIYCYQMQARSAGYERPIRLAPARPVEWVTLQGAERDGGSRQICLTRSAETRATTERDDADRMESEGVDLIVEATSGSPLGSADLLERAVVLLRENTAARARVRDFWQWVVNVSNLGCALTLLAKGTSGVQSAARFEEAVDAFQGLLKEPMLREMDSQYAHVHVNLADTLQALAGIALPAERVRYLESAINSLVAALDAIAPERFRKLLTFSSVIRT
jgi:hypothetical protein